MKRLMTSARRFLIATLVLSLAAGGVALGSNVGTLLAQNAGSDMDSTEQAAFWTAIGGGAVGKLGLGTGFSNSGGNLAINIATALGYTPANKAGDTFTGLVALTVNAAATAAGTNAGTCTAITTQTTIFTTVASGTGFCLNATIGVPQEICNQGANVLTGYPPPGAAIYPYSTNAAVTLAVGACAGFRMNTSTLASVN
jgi:hypothetical protein